METMHAAHLLNDGIACGSPNHQAIREGSPHYVCYEPVFHNDAVAETLCIRRDVLGNPIARRVSQRACKVDRKVILNAEVSGHVIPPLLRRGFPPRAKILGPHPSI
jgi:hypothetical protein